MTAEPVIKWVGGKTRLLTELLARMPGTYGRYYEPFAGGAALFFRLAPERAVLADANKYLVNLYRVLAHGDVEVLIAFLQWHQDEHDKHRGTHYYRVRGMWNGSTAWGAVQRAAAFVYLNKTCFNGLWRVNQSGEFNVPMGDYKQPVICNPDALRTAARALARAELREGDYRLTTEDVVAGDLVYLDPPYVPASETSDFTSYTAGGFGAAEQRELADRARALVHRGVHVVLSNSDTPLVRELYAGFQLDTVQCGRAINSNASKRGAVNELVITAPTAAAARAS